MHVGAGFGDSTEGGGGNSFNVLFCGRGSHVSQPGDLNECTSRSW